MHKKQPHHQKHALPLSPSEHVSSTTEAFLATVPVTISMWHGETLLDAEEEERAVDGTPATEEAH
jgi:hypothetical protein